jgi:hypothetical protein
MAKGSQERSKLKPLKATKKVAAVKQSAKKQRQGLKYRDTDLRLALDSQIQEIFAVSSFSKILWVVNPLKHTCILDDSQSERTTAGCGTSRGCGSCLRKNHA